IRRVAIKVARFDLHSNPQLAERFQREIRAMAALRHPNICSILDVGEENGVIYLAMPYIEGRSLSEVLRDGRHLSQQEAAELVHKLALAMAHAHGHHVLHRDLKPANVILNTQNEPIIMDFGLARLPEQTNVTATGAPLGTPAFMPPEQ